jgi:hypothetical protein
MARKGDEIRRGVFHWDTAINVVCTVTFLFLTLHRIRVITISLTGYPGLGLLSFLPSLQADADVLP